MSTHVTKENLQEFASKIHAKNKTLFALKSQMGTPPVVTTAASMTDQTKIYVYMGTETGYIKGGWYYYSGSAWTFGGMYNSGDWIGDDLKQALLQLASKVAYIDDDGQDYYDALESALYHDATLVSISAVYTQSGTVYATDSLNSLKSDLVVTAIYDDSSTVTIPSASYALSGALTTGTSTITVTYGGKTTTFTVAVTYSFNMITRTGALTSGRTGHTNDTVMVSNVGENWYSVSIHTGAKFGTLCLSDINENLKTSHPYANANKVCDVNGASMHIEIKDVIVSNSGSDYYYLFTAREPNATTGTEDVSEQFNGNSNRSITCTPEFNELGALGIYINQIMDISFKIKALLY